MANLKNSYFLWVNVLQIRFELREDQLLKECGKSAKTYIQRLVSLKIDNIGVDLTVSGYSKKYK